MEIQSVVEDAFSRLDKKMKEGISEDEMEVFFRVLEKINSNLERNDAEND